MYPYRQEGGKGANQEKVKQQQLQTLASEELYDITEKKICKSDCHNLKVRDLDERKYIRK